MANVNPGAQPANEMSKMKKFFVSCGGATLATFSKTNLDDQQKRTRNGMVVFVVATTSAIIASIAWAVPMGTPGYTVGLIWFAVMLGLEVSILQQMDYVAAYNLVQKWMKGDFHSDKDASVGVSWLLTRFLMIFFICYFNSEMIRVIMFKPEIVSEIKLRQDKETSAIIDSLHNQKVAVKKQVEKKEDDYQKSNDNLETFITSYDQKISTIDDSLNYWNSKLIYEVKGPGGVSGIVGDGPTAKTIRESIARYGVMKTNLIAERDSAKTQSVASNSVSIADRELKEARVRAKEQLADIDSMQKKLVQQVLDRPVNGLYFMVSVLNDIASRSFLIWAVFFMFFFIEGIPVLLKFFSKNDSFIHQKALEIMKDMKETSEEASKLHDEMEELKRKNAAANT